MTDYTIGADKGFQCTFWCEVPFWCIEGNKKEDEVFTS